MREKRREATIERIVETAMSMLEQEGFEALTIQRLAKRLGPGHTIVTLLCDSGLRYQARMFNSDYLESKGMRLPDWLADE